MAVEINYNWDKSTFVGACKANYLHSLGSRRSIILSIFIVLYLVAALYLGSRLGMEWSGYLSVFIAVYWFVLRFPLYVWLTGRRFDKHVEKDANISWVIDDKGMKSVGANSSGEFNWNLVTDAIKSKHGYLIYRYPLYHWFPFASFENEHDKLEFERLIIENVSNQKIKT